MVLKKEESNKKYFIGLGVIVLLLGVYFIYSIDLLGKVNNLIEKSDNYFFPQENNATNNTIEFLGETIILTRFLCLSIIIFSIIVIGYWINVFFNWGREIKNYEYQEDDE